MKRAYAPWTRAIKRGDHGNDVLAVKRALHHQGIIATPMKRLTPRAGADFTKTLKRYQRSHGLRATGTYTRATHQKLREGKHFDRYGAHLLARWEAAHKPRPAGRAIAAAALYGHAHAPRHYTQGGSRWQPVDRVPWEKHMWDDGDCSSFATGCFRQAGVKTDPNGLGWRAGYTGTLCRHGKRVSTPAPGDLVFYGSGPPWHHVTVYVGNGRVVSHGTEGGPFLEPMDYRSDRGEIRRYV